MSTSSKSSRPRGWTSRVDVSISVGDWLARNGVESHCSSEVSTGAEARQLAAIARDLKADLIVAGAFGHSRLREWAFGGVTKDLLLHADRCVLASH